MHNTAINQNSSVPASPRYYDPTNDVAFKRLFSDKRRLMRFLNAILHKDGDEEIVELEFIPQHKAPNIGDGRSVIFDIYCTDQKGQVFIVEMQNRLEKNFLHRVQYYGSCSIAEQPARGDSSIELMPVILVAICNHVLFQDEGVEHVNQRYTVEAKTGKRFLYALSYVFIELPKFKKTEDELEANEDEWLYFFANWERTAAPPKTITDPLVLEAYSEMERFNWTKEEFNAYVRANLSAGAYYGTMEAKLQEGRNERSKEIAKNFLSSGIDIEIIAKNTGLTPDEIKDLSRT